MGRRLRCALRASRSAALASAVALAPVAALPAAGTATGVWRTADGDALIEIAECGAPLCGRLVWMRDPPHDDDRNNPDPALRARRLCGLEILWGFVAAGENAWNGGSVYDAKSGNTYRGTLRLEPDGALSLRGYVGIPLFGRSERWTRDAAPERCAR
jgi:uncharacterized protein (DUF2147 family)